MIKPMGLVASTSRQQQLFLFFFYLNISRDSQFSEILVSMSTWFPIQSVFLYFHLFELRDRANRFIEKSRNNTMKGDTECVYSWWWLLNMLFDVHSSSLSFSHNGFLFHSTQYSIRSLKILLILAYLSCVCFALSNLRKSLSGVHIHILHLLPLHSFFCGHHLEQRVIIMKKICMSSLNQKK